MKNKAIVAFLIFLLTSRLPLTAQDAKRLAVIPFNFINLPQQEMEQVFTAFEDALRRTGAYSVIGRDEITAALNNMGLGLIDCTSQLCAADLALRLSADQWVRGELVGREGRYALKVKVVEVASGRATYLDRLSSPSLEQMEKSLELFAFKLAGLTLTIGKEERIAREFGEVLVETIPAQAEIFINGVKKGIGPDLIRRVPLGRVRITAQLGTLYAEKLVEITRSLQQVRIELVERPGSLQVIAKGLLEVYLDGTLLGPLGEGIFAGIVPGVHTLELLGQGLYWQDEVVLRANERTTVTAEPRPYGTIDYEIPPGAIAEVRGELIREVVTGIGVLRALAGEYSAVVSGRDYEKLEGLGFAVTKESMILLRPELKFSRSYELERFSRRIEDAARAISFGYRLTSDDLLKLKDLRQEIAQSRHDFSGLVNQMDLLIDRAEAFMAEESAVTVDTDHQEPERRLDELLGRKQQLELQIESRRIEGKKKTRGGWISLGVGLVSGGLAGLFYYISDAAYQDYQQAKSWEEAQRKETAVRLWDISTIAALSVSGICAVVSSTLWITRPSTREIRNELQSLETQIELMRSSEPPH